MGNKRASNVTKTLSAGVMNAEISAAVGDPFTCCLLWVKNIGANPGTIGIGQDASNGHLLAAGDDFHVFGVDAAPDEFIYASSILGTSFSIIRAVQKVR